MHTTSLIRAIWIAGLLLRLLVLFALVRGRLYRDIRAFSVYSLYGALADASLWLAQRNYPVYFYTYWTSEFLYVALDFIVIGAIYLRLGRTYAIAKRAAARVLYSTLAVFGVLSAAAIALRQQSAVGRLVETIEVVLRSAKIVQLGALLALFLIAHFISVRMRPEDRLVALGLAVITASDVVGLALVHQFGTQYATLISASTMLGNACGMLIWGVGLLRLRRGLVPVPAIPEIPIAAWSDTLEEMLDK